MYSWEIDNIIKENKYVVSVDTYTKICETSPQITRVRYQPFGDYFEIWTSDEYYWRFSLRKGD